MRKEMDTFEVDEENTAVKVLHTLWRHKGLVLFLVMAAVIVGLGFLWKGAAEKQEKLTEQLEYQQDLIDALEKKVGKDSDSSHETVPVITSETVKSQLNSLQDLVTQEYIYTNADKEESEKTWIFGWTRPFSSKSIMITYDGTIKAGIDLGAIEVSVNEDSKTITVSLPDSTVLENNIPPDTVTVLEVKNGLFNEVTIDNYNEFVDHQKEVMEQKAIDRGLLTKADEEAAKAVRALLSTMPGIDAYTLNVQ